MTEIGFIIQPGESIPEDVTGVSDTDGDVWWLTAIDHWHLGSGGGEPRGCERTVELQRARVRANAPLTVTAVREQPAGEPVSTEIYWPVGTAEALDNLRGVFTSEEAAKAALTEGFDYSSIVLDRSYPTLSEALGEQPAEPERDDLSVAGLCEVGADRVTCIVADADHRRIYHGGSTLGDVATTLLAAEPVPDVLDLVRQFGRSQYGAGYQVASLDAAKADREVTEAGALFARIEAEVNRLRAERDDATSAVTIQRLAFAMPQQPVQARNFAGHPWWIHGCGTAWAASGTPRVKCPGCDHNDKPWRPLLLGEVMREPRTWPKLDAQPEIDDLPDVVEVNGWRWWRVTEMDGTGSTYHQPGQPSDRTLRQLREIAEVREVFDDKDSTR